MAKKKQAYANDVYIGLTQPVRVLFPPKLDEPVKVDGRGDPKFEITIGFPEDHPDYLEMYQISQRLADEKSEDWGLEGVDLGTNVDVKFKSGDEEYEYYAKHKDPEKRREYDFLKGMIIMKLRSKEEIGVFDTRRRDDRGTPVKVTDKNEIRSTIYAGCNASLRLTFATYDAIVTRENPNANPGVTAYPEQVCFVSDGDRLSRGNNDSGQGFAQVQGAVSAEDPTGGEE